MILVSEGSFRVDFQPLHFEEMPLCVGEGPADVVDAVDVAVLDVFDIFVSDAVCEVVEVVDCTAGPFPKFSSTQ